MSANEVDEWREGIRAREAAAAERVAADVQPSHPRRLDGTPILVGDWVLAPSDLRGATSWQRVIQVRWIDRTRESWIHTEQNSNVVLTESDLQDIEREAGATRG